MTVNLEYDYQMPVASSAVPDSSLQVQQKHNVTSVAHSLPNFGMHMQTTHASIPIKWNSEQIADFVRRLGFLDIAGCVGDQRKHFQLLNKVRSFMQWLLEGTYVSMFSAFHLFYTNTCLCDKPCNVLSVFNVNMLSADGRKTGELAFKAE